jgi:DNA anti-recombination protein RmuC
MPFTGDSEMLERLERVEAKVDRLATELVAVETRLGDRLVAVETRLGDRLVAVETRLGNRLVAVETRLGDRIGRAEVQIDHLRGDLQKVAEGYTVGLNAISRQITAFQTDLNQKLLDRDLVLQDHGRRISALEQSGSQ